MKSRALLAVGAFSVALGVGGAMAQTSQATGNQPAAPSQKPAQQATTAASTDQTARVDPSTVGNQQAAPSQTPASQATTATNKLKP
jgi:hypothetical protein